jgi:E3 ubiquitin-protein ligase SIAH1
VCSITGGYQRCVVLEKIMESIQIPCPNTLYGCTVKTQYIEGADHHKSCRCALCFCPEPDCDFAGSTAELLDHLTHTDNCPATEFDYGRRFDLQIQEGLHVLYSREGSDLFLVKFTPVPPFGIAVSIVCVDPHAVVGERKFRCLVGSNCSTDSWRSAFRTISTNLFDCLSTEDGSYSLVVPTLSCYSINVTISKVSGL